MKSSQVLRIVAGVVLLGLVATVLFILPWSSGLDEWLEAIPDMGAWGPLLYGVIYVLAVVLFVPGSVLTMGAGFAFGLVVGVITVSLASTIGAAAAFLVGRTLGRAWIQAKVNTNPKFRALDEAIKQQGFRIVFLLRLSPAFPFNLLNYSLGLTSVSFRDYVLASWIGMFPGAVLYIYLGTTLKNLADLSTGKATTGAAGWLFLGAGLVATAVVTIIISGLARKALNEVVPGDKKAPSCS
jgi:uncharacterized membrane protein YdjX (TVP38/TMEM64 family)